MRRYRRRPSIVGVVVLGVLALPWAGLLLANRGAAGAGMDAPEPLDEPISPVTPLPGLDPRKVALGRRLFADARLSRDQRVSCTSCHDVGHNGADALRLDLSPRGAPLPVNTPTVFNAVRNFRLNWRGNLSTLEEQVEFSFDNPDIMGTDMRLALQRLHADPGIGRQARAIYGRAIDRTAIVDAIAEYERSLTTPGARFDRWLLGDANALSAQELRGYQTFKKVGCVSCHQGANVGGNLYQSSSIFPRPGAPAPLRLRVPSLRNVATTAPYFHDGGAATLPEAVQIMARSQLGIELEPVEVDDITAFLGTLTGLHDSRPVTAPPR